MRRNLITRTTAAVAASLLLSSSITVAQLDDDFVEPEQYQDIKTALVLNGNAPAALDERIDASLREAHLRVGGRISNNRRNGYFEVSGLPDRISVVRAARDMASDIEANIVFIEGGDSQSTVGFASNFPETVFVDVGQPVPCVDLDGDPDRTGACAGGERALPGNHIVIDFNVEDPAYLAGVVAASASNNDRLGVISGMADCRECNRYIEGFTRGARSVKPDIDIELAYLADDDEGQAFGDITSARTFADAFIHVYQPDVLLPTAGDASVGMIEAACDAGIQAIGTGIDVAAEYPDLDQCVLASITKDVERAVRDTLYDFTGGLGAGRIRTLTLEDGGVGLTEEWRRLTTLPVDTPRRYEDALNGIITGAVDTCSDDCGAGLGQAADEEVPADT